MTKVWLVIEENEYGSTVAALCSSESLAEEAKDTFQKFADLGSTDDSNDYQESFYGKYVVEERVVATKADEIKKSWHLNGYQLWPDEEKC